MIKLLRSTADRICNLSFLERELIDKYIEILIFTSGRTLV